MVIINDPEKIYSSKYYHIMQMDNIEIPPYSILKHVLLIKILMTFNFILY